MNRRALWIAGASQALVLSLVGCVALDLYAHRHAEDVAGLTWATGPVAHQKQPERFVSPSRGEERLASARRRPGRLRPSSPGGDARDRSARKRSCPITLHGLERCLFARTLDGFVSEAGLHLHLRRPGVGARRRKAVRPVCPTGYWPALPVALEEKGMLGASAACARGTTGKPRRHRHPERFAAPRARVFNSRANCCRVRIG